MSFAQTLNVSIAASWLVLALILLRPLLGKAPKALRCALWALVAVRLLCPALPQSPASLLPTAQVVPETVLTMEPAQNSETPATLDIITNPIYPKPVDVKLNTNVSRFQWSELYWTLIWTVGMGIMMIYACVSYLRLRLRTRVAVRQAGNVWLCDDIDSPFILGVIRPRICLPSSLTEEQQAHVIAHEKAHLRRLDHWWKPFGFTLLTVHWFNPVMWIAYVLLCRDIELACDEAVIRTLDKPSVRAYSEALISCSIRGRGIAACPLAFGEVGVKERIRAMLRYKKPGFWVMVIAAAVSLILVVCFLTNPASTTIGNFREPQFTMLFENAPNLLFRSGESVCRVDSPDDFVRALKQIAINPNEVSRSLAEDRDRTYEIIHGATVLCVSEDFSRIWVDDGVKPSYTYAVKEPEALRELLTPFLPTVSDDNGLAEPPLGTYVPYQCLYMNHLSSYYPWGGDSGAIYHLGKNSFTTEFRSGGVHVNDSISQSWEPIPWTTDFFRELAVYENIIDSPSLTEFVSKDVLHRFLTEDDFLLWENNTLILVHTAELKGTGRTMWCAYLLVPQSQMGTADWSFNPITSAGYPAFRFEFDFSYTHITVSAFGGTLTRFDESTGTSYGQGYFVEFPAGEAVYWMPTDGEGNPVTEGKISFSVFQGETMLAQGTLYLSGEYEGKEYRPGGQEDKEYHPMVFTAELIGTGLRLEQNPQNSGGIIKPME